MKKNQRIHYEKPTYYNNGVLIGSWVENRASSLVETHKHRSNYSDEYVPKPNAKIDPALMWDAKLQFEDTNFISQVGKNEHPNYWENFTTTYDLSYNHFPKCIGAPIPRTLRVRTKTYEPSDDYIPTFGNLTEYGLKKYKLEKWACEVSDPRLTYSSSYRDDYTPPSDESYRFKRYGTPCVNSTAMENSFKKAITIHYRNQPIYRIPDANNTIAAKREPEISVITWDIPIGTKMLSENAAAQVQCATPNPAA